MRDHSQHIELSREDAVAGMLAALPETFAAAAERMPLDQACGRVLACDVASKTQVPNALTCALDSVALRWADFEEAAQAHGEGAIPDTSAWVRGVQWQFANTGIAMPCGFDTAIVIENVEVSEDEKSIRILKAPSRKNAGTREAGGKLQVGDVIATEGQVITADLAAGIAGGNHTNVLVRRKPRVAFIPTGNELETPGSAVVGYGKNIETNSIVVREKVRQWGGEFVPFDVVRDLPESIAAAVREATAIADIVVLNAGSSKGSDDWSCEQMEKLGKVICHQTNHGPGHHSSYFVVNDTPIVGISGPAAGASFTLNFYLLPVMQRFLGLPTEPKVVHARLAEPFPANPFKKKTDVSKLPGEQRPPEANEPGKKFFGVRFLTLELDEQGVMQAYPIAGRPGSAATQHANAYCLVPSAPGDEAPQVGDIIRAEWR